MVIERKRKVKKVIFGENGKISETNEQAVSKTDLNKKDAISTQTVIDNGNKQNLNSNTKPLNGQNNLTNNKALPSNADSILLAKQRQLDSLINLLNKLIGRAASRLDVRAIVKQEMQTLMDELNATFAIQIAELKMGERPSSLLLQLIRFNKAEEVKLPNGNRIYLSGSYKEIAAAEKYCRDFQTSGFKEAKVIKRIPEK